MKKIVLSILNRFSNHIATPFLIRTARQKFIAPVYHLASNEPAPHVKHLYPVRSAKQFSYDLDFFLTHYSPIALSDLVLAVKKGKAITQNTFFLSFDDGLRECYEVVAPILKAKGVPATFFLNSAFIDNKGLFFKYKISLIIDKILSHVNKEKVLKKVGAIFTHYPISSDNLLPILLACRYDQLLMIEAIAADLEIDFNTYLNEHQPYLTTQQIQALMNDGHTIGAHSIHHPHYADLSLEDQLHQTRESIGFITNQFNAACKAFAFPFTDFGVSKHFFQLLHHTNHPIADISFGSAGIKKDVSPYHIHRLPIEKTTATAKQVVNTELLYYLLKIVLNKNKIVRS
jgi:peptidoglycan/xylan/chitin deacetylase (PgdA/CDA1 family)